MCMCVHVVSFMHRPHATTLVYRECALTFCICFFQHRCRSVQCLPNLSPNTAFFSVSMHCRHCVASSKRLICLGQHFHTKLLIMCLRSIRLPECLLSQFEFTVNNRYKFYASQVSFSNVHRTVLKSKHIFCICVYAAFIFGNRIYFSQHSITALCACLFCVLEYNVASLICINVRSHTAIQHP